MDAIAGALGRSSSSDLIPALREQLADQNLVLLHNPIFEKDFENESLVEYYTSWWPELLAQAQSNLGSDRGGVKLIQGIAWCRVFALQRGTAWLLQHLGASRAEWIQRALEWRAAQNVIDKIERDADPRLSILTCELEDIGREDVRKWSQLLPRSPREREQIVEIVLHGAKDSQDILERITQYLRIPKEK
jgi:hypothetical protein